jgi:hypothetical protein
MEKRLNMSQAKRNVDPWCACDASSKIGFVLVHSASDSTLTMAKLNGGC